MRRHVGQGDDKMPPQGRGGPGQGGGGKRHHLPDQDDDDDIDSIINGIQDLRTDDDREFDIRRRLASQCIYVGWFRCKPGPPPEPPMNPGGKYRYRRCEKDSTRGTPWCYHHRDKPNQDRDSDTTPKPKPPKDQDKDKDKGKEKKKPSSFPPWMTGLLGTGEIAGNRKK